jgi:hypothetical protein
LLAATGRGPGREVACRLGLAGIVATVAMPAKPGGDYDSDDSDGEMEALFAAEAEKKRKLAQAVSGHDRGRWCTRRRFDHSGGGEDGAMHLQSPRRCTTSTASASGADGGGGNEAGAATDFIVAADSAVVPSGDDPTVGGSKLLHAMMDVAVAAESEGSEQPSGEPALGGSDLLQEMMEAAVAAETGPGQQQEEEGGERGEPQERGLVYEGVTYVETGEQGERGAVVLDGEGQEVGQWVAGDGPGGSVTGGELFFDSQEAYEAHQASPDYCPTRTRAAPATKDGSKRPRSSDGERRACDEAVTTAANRANKLWAVGRRKQKRARATNTNTNTTTAAAAAAAGSGAGDDRAVDEPSGAVEQQQPQGPQKEGAQEQQHEEELSPHAACTLEVVGVVTARQRQERAREAAVDLTSATLGNSSGGGDAAAAAAAAASDSPVSPDGLSLEVRCITRGAGAATTVRVTVGGDRRGRGGSVRQLKQAILRAAQGVGLAGCARAPPPYHIIYIIFIYGCGCGCGWRSWDRS